MSRSRDLTLGCVVGFLLPILVIVGLVTRGNAAILGFVDRFWKNKEVIDLKAMPPVGSTVSEIKRIDADGDGDEEWFVSYQYDLVGARNPVSCVVYDVEGSTLPIVYPYLLRTPDGDYLGEDLVFVSQEDVLNDGIPSRQALEMIITDGKTMSIFAVRDVDPRPAGSWTEYPNPYECMGFFKATLGVSRVADAVSVRDRAGNERSQFALKRVYKPSQGSYFYPDTTTLLPPAEASIEFAFGMPTDVPNTPYPEKLVLAYYHQVLTGDVAPYLSEHGKQLLAAGRLDYGSPWSKAETARVLVQEISYVPAPDNVASTAAGGSGSENAEVRVKARFFGPQGRTRMREIIWQVVKQGTQWKLNEAASFDI